MTITTPNNSDMLSSGIGNVATLLANDDRINVLLYAMEHIPMDVKYVDPIFQHRMRLATPCVKLQSDN